MPTRARVEPVGGRNALAVATALKHLSGRLGDDLAAMAEACRSLADAVDENPTNAALWKEYRGALADLRTATMVEDSSGDEFDNLIAALSS